MKSKVVKLFDPSNIEIPQELKGWRIGEEEADKLLDALAQEYYTEFEADAAAEGDSVFCRAAAGSALADRTVIIYPGRGMPCAEEAEKKAAGLRKGDKFTAVLGGMPVELTVEKIVRRLPSKIDDELICSLGIDGITTPGEYRAYAKQQREEENRTLSARELSAYMLDAAVEGSEYEIDPAEEEAWLNENAKMMFEYSLSDGIDPRIPDEGFDFLTDEEAIEKIKEEIRPQFRSQAVCAALCEKSGFTFGSEDAETPDLPGDEDLISEMYTSKAWDILFDTALRRLEEEDK